MPRLYFLLVNFRSTSDSSFSTLSPLLSSFCRVLTLKDLGCIKLTQGLLNLPLGRESFMGVFIVLFGFAPLGITPLLTYCCSGIMCGSNSLSTPWTSGTVSPLAFTEAMVPTQKSSISLNLQKLTGTKSEGLHLHYGACSNSLPISCLYLSGNTD